MVCHAFLDKSQQLLRAWRSFNYDPAVVGDSVNLKTLWAKDTEDPFAVVRKMWLLC